MDVLCVTSKNGGGDIIVTVRNICFVVFITNDQPMKMFLIRGCCICYINAQEIHMHVFH